ncbi:hypothetical protein [Leptospira noguchii]|nr:hypothetical protein [Leptospira noguchii]UOG48021.1 hypothetical protein MAL00_13365 [Leptospira noguchii]
MNELKQNAFYESVGNSAKRFPTGRVLGSRFKLRLRTMYCIMFPACN